MDFSNIGVFFAAAEKGAANIYHKLLALDAQVHAWEAANPAMAVLLQSGIDYATGALTRAGVPVGAIVVTAEDILTAAKGFAALDPTVASLPVAAVAGGQP